MDRLQARKRKRDPLSEAEFGVFFFVIKAEIA